MSKDYTHLNKEHAHKMFDDLQMMQCDPRRTSGTECIAHCPFHDDETPSFSLNMERGVFYCHACPAQGTYWDFQALLKRDGFCELRKPEKAPPLKKEGKKQRQKLFRIVDAYRKHPTPLKVSKKEVQECIEDIVLYWHEYLMENHSSAGYLVSEEYEETFERKYFEMKSHSTQRNTHTYISPRFTKQTLVTFRIGYAPPSSVELTRKLKKKYSQDVIIGTGLVRRCGNGGLITPYSGRIVYPYLDGITPVYSIARLTPFSPQNLSDCKYLKQRTRDREHLFPFKNPPLFNERMIEPFRQILITEGVTDAIKACEVGVQAVSPVTIFFKNEYLDKIAHLLEHKQVVICNDAERTGSGERGMEIMAHELRKRDVAVQCAHLPLEQGQEKVDVCSFINDHGAEAFHALLKEQTGISFDTHTNAF